MYTKTFRYLLMVVAIGATLISLYARKYELASIAGFLFAFVLYSHYKYASILLASKHFKKGDYEQTESILDEISKPDLLARSRRGYYEFMRASIALQREDFESAEFHFQMASRFPLGSKNDKAFVLIHLANLALRKRDKERALAYAEKAGELASSSRAKSIINVIEEEARTLA